MAYTTINKSTSYFNDKFYTGNGSTNALTGLGFLPDWVWIKYRDDTYGHRLMDSVRGATKELYSNNTGAENTTATGLTSFDSDGFTLGSSSGVNHNGGTFASWSWKAGGGAGSSNTDGSINTTSTSVNTTAGFSISKYTGTGSTATFGHGLGAVPKMIIIKRTNDTEHWQVYHQSLGNTKVIELSSNGAAFTDSNRWNNTTPTNSLVTLGNHASVNASGSTYVAYCFAEKTGYSKFGSYIGNGNNDGAFVYTGFKPKLVVVKEHGATGNWIMKYDFIQNQNDTYVLSNDSASEASGAVVGFDLVSNGFKLRGTAGDSNGNGASILYWAFGQSLVGSNNIPATAR